MAVHRLQFDLLDEAYEEFETLRTTFNFQTEQELFQAAVRYLQWTWEHVSTGEAIHLVKDDSSVKVILPYFPASG